MIQSFRDNLKGPFAIGLVVLMAIPFVLFGVDSLFTTNHKAGVIAEVNGEEISEVSLQRAVRMQKQQLLQRFGDQAPAELLSDERLREPVLNRMVQRELLQQAAANGSMTVASPVLDANIVNTEAFQQSGKFSSQRYTQLLANMGYTPAGYKNQLLEDAIVSQLANGIVNSSLSTAKELDALVALTQQQRSFSYFMLPFDQAAKTVNVSEQNIDDFYQANQAQFMAPEMVSMNYIDVSLDALAADVIVDPADVKAQYQAEVDSFQSQTQRQVAHILIEAGEGSDSKIAEVQKALDSGEDFAEVAKQYSDDSGSIQQGGDLGFTDGTIFPEAFEAAAASLSVGEVSPAVETEAGTHFIKLISEEKSQPPTFEESKERIANTLAQAEAESTFVNLLNELPDATYNAASLAVAAESLGLEAKTSELFSRKGGDGIFSNNQVLAAAFSDDVLNEGLASNVLELGNNELVVIKLAQHVPSQVKPLAEVSDEIREQLVRQQATEQLAKDADGLIAKLTQGEALSDVANGESTEVVSKSDMTRNAPETEVDPQLLAHVFDQPKPNAGETLYSQVTLANGDTAVVALTGVQAGNFDEEDAQLRTALQGRLAQELGSMDMLLYQNALKNRADIEIYE